jgi:RNA polymerase sigma-70 factor (ECF subfamily)
MTKSFLTRDGSKAPASEVVVMSAPLARGDQPGMTPATFDEFYQRTFRDVYRYVFRAVVGDRSLAEDLTQETFASVVKAFHEGRAEIDSMPWMIGVARHKVIDHYRKTESEQRRLASVWAERSDSSDELDWNLEDTDPARLLEILRGVSPIHRLVLILRYVDDLAVTEVAHAVGRSIHATESLLVRARRELVRCYGETLP